ncbi:MAG: primosomal protein N' [Culturomica sp.]|nr:primosomal protein N' [Culturomica sp.]
MFADIILPLAVEGLFTYSLPPALEQEVKEGMLVWVSFAGQKKYAALVCRIHNTPPEGYTVKPIEGISEEHVRFSPDHLRFLMWVAEYYMASPGEVLRAALPVVFRLESVTRIARTEQELAEDEVLPEKEEAMLRALRPGEYIALQELEKYLRIRNGLPYVKSLLNRGLVRIRETVDEAFLEKKEKRVVWARLFTEREKSEILDGLKRAPGQHRLFCRWLEAACESRERKHLLTEAGSAPAVLKALCDKGILAIEEHTVSRFVVEEQEVSEGYPLSAGQQEALGQIRNFFNAGKHVLLQGVTSSGKTEVYIRLIRSLIDEGKQVLYMLPEIALTVQIVKRLKRVFGNRIGVYHSGMSESLRAELWRKQSGDDPYPLVLGVRSSLFLPFRQLGLVIVDEEHDASYKQKEPAPRYQGRDAAVMLAAMHGARVLLGSATPSFETLRNAYTGKYGRVELTQRYGGIEMPELLFADLAEYRRKKLMKGSFSPLLIQKMQQTLEAGYQVILFQNRRGYSTYLQCDRCGSIPKCRRCDVSLTYYKERNVLNCRYCGSLSEPPAVCGVCGQGRYRMRTPGTERIEEEVAALFPGARVARMDLEAMSSRSGFRRVIDDFEQKRIDVLIGTQMVSKGLDFEHVKLVGVMDADSMVHFPDFRAEERAYQMLMQVSGRSGRKGERGTVVIQAADRKNRLYDLLEAGDYAEFYREAMAEREAFSYPPFCRLIRIELRHPENVVLRNAANRLAEMLRKRLGRRVCGPAVPEVGRIGNRYRLILLIKIEEGASFSRIKQFLKESAVSLSADKACSGLRVLFDVDP